MAAALADAESFDRPTLPSDRFMIGPIIGSTPVRSSWMSSESPL